MEFLIFPKIDKPLEVFFSTLLLKKNKDRIYIARNKFLSSLVMVAISRTLLFWYKSLYTIAAANTWLVSWIPTPKKIPLARSDIKYHSIKNG